MSRSRAPIAGRWSDALCGLRWCPPHVFKALANPARRFLLDLLFARDGRTLIELESELEMTRIGVMKHLRVLEDAGLVVTRRSGREKLHFLNPVPIRLIYDRWIDKYRQRRTSELANLKSRLEAKGCAPTAHLRSRSTTRSGRSAAQARPNLAHGDGPGLGRGGVHAPDR